MERYSKKQLEEMSDLKFAQCILQDRLNKLTNPYSLLSAKLRLAINKLDRLDNQPVRKNWWDVIYSDENGDKRRAADMDDAELKRIGQLVAEGYSCGEIYGGEEL